MKYGELNLGQIEAVVNKLGGMEGVKSFLSSETMVSAPAETITNLFHLQVNYDLSMEEAIKAGNYYWEDTEITDKNFKTSRSGQQEVELKLFHFNKKMTLEKAISGMNRQGYRPAELSELLALGAKYPDEQRKYSIIAIGSVCRRLSDYCGVVCLCLSGSGRGLRLDLNYFIFEWSESYRFAAVRK